MGEQSKWRRKGGSRRGAATVLIAASALVAVVASSSAHVGERPVISGEPVVGETLTSSSAGDTALYKWQRCDPATSTCADAPAGDASWVNIDGAHGREARSYLLTEADLGKYVRVLAKGTSLGEVFSPSTPLGPVTAPEAPPAPQEPPAEEPQHGVQLIGDPVSGTVTVQAPGESGFTQLDTTKPIPVGSLIDTRAGRIGLTAATGVFGDTTPDKSMDFYGGLFRVQQSPATNSIAVARLVGKPSCGSSAEAGKSSAGGPAAATSRRRRGKRLWGSGSGSYGTAGKGGTGSVVGTTWLTKETCNGTLFKVSDEPGGHGISVDPKGKAKPVFLGPGDSYLAER